MPADAGPLGATESALLAYGFTAVMLAEFGHDGVADGNRQRSPTHQRLCAEPGEAICADL
jgi:hypothetical protein